MRVRVRFRFNAVSGEVELFQVDDLGARQTGAAPSSGAEHDAEHDRISAEVGSVAARRPDVEEVRPVAGLTADVARWSDIRRVEEPEPSWDAAETGELGTQ